MNLDLHSELIKIVRQRNRWIYDPHYRCKYNVGILKNDNWSKINKELTEMGFKEPGNEV